MDWLTNDAAIAKRLRAVDRAREKAREKCANWSLKEKVEAFRKIDLTRDAAYARIMGGAK